MRPAAHSLFNAHPIPGAGLAAPPQPIESKAEVKARPTKSDRTEQFIFGFPSVEGDHIRRPKRLGRHPAKRDRIDLYWMHNWDANTPIDETMATLDDLVHAGKVRYIGVSDTPVSWGGAAPLEVKAL